MRAFRLLDHTGDVGVVARGRDLQELFQNAARALFFVITDRRRIRKRLNQSIEVWAPDLESLLVAWMGELLFLFDARGLLFRSFHVESLEQDHLKATAWGEPYQESRHPIKTGVKAVTYHQIRVEKRAGLWQARIILDI
jgi:SHS2 domain-containing protein